MGEISEKEIQNESLRLLLSHPKVSLAFIPAAGTTSGRKFRGVGMQKPKGLPDLVGMLQGGRFYAIEFKKPGGKPSKEQIEILRKITEAGGLSLMAFSVEDVACFLKSLTSSNSNASPKSV